MAFTERFWEHLTPVYEAITAHPFLQGLTSGDLPEAAFRYYVVQDALYLRDFARGLALLGSQAPDDDALMTLCDHAKNAIVVERALHAGFLSQWELTMDAVLATEKAPTCQAYTAFLLETAERRSWFEGLCAHLPCYWIYLQVGQALVTRGSPHPLYQQWIDSYAGDEFRQVVEEMLALVEAAADGKSDADHAAGLALGREAARYEFLFWDMGYTQQAWPV
ncbi:MAG: thiaminase II [Opitutales bacterium]